ncbi:MAG: FAD-dependent oxidoreductase [Candidatus Omnitrophica bacterium]|nr:FAD-dependent oxidoreductase [Candidatus Omnitrophota bacterium]
MRSIIIIGNSAAGLSCASAIRQQDAESKITIVSDENRPAYQRFKLFDYLYQQVKESALFEPYQDFYQRNNIELVNNIVSAVDPSKKRIYFKEKGFLEFDKLVIACGRKPKMPQIKGVNKNGVVSIYNLDDVKHILEIIPLLQTVCIAGDNGIADKLTEFFVRRKIEVKLLRSQLKEGLQMDLVEHISDAQIQEILGEGDIKAVKLSNNKIIGTNLVVYTQVLSPNIDLVKETSIECNNGIMVDSSMLTSVQDIYAAGDVAEIRGQEKQYSWVNAEQEGTAAGRSICQN